MGLVESQSVCKEIKALGSAKTAEEYKDCLAQYESSNSCKTVDLVMNLINDVDDFPVKLPCWRYTLFTESQSHRVLH